MLPILGEIHISLVDATAKDIIFPECLGIRRPQATPRELPSIITMISPGAWLPPWKCFYICEPSAEPNSDCPVVYISGSPLTIILPARMTNPSSITPSPITVI
jgi:hypothetical protein